MRDLSCGFSVTPFRKKSIEWLEGRKPMYTHCSHLIKPWAAEVTNIIVCVDLDSGMGEYGSYSCFLRELEVLKKTEQLIRMYFSHLVP